MSFSSEELNKQLELTRINPINEDDNALASQVSTGICTSIFHLQLLSMVYCHSHNQIIDFII